MATKVAKGKKNQDTGRQMYSRGPAIKPGRIKGHLHPNTKAAMVRNMHRILSGKA